MMKYFIYLNSIFSLMFFVILYRSMSYLYSSSYHYLLNSFLISHIYCVILISK